MAAHRILIAHVCTVGAVREQPARGRLLISRADRAVEERPCSAVAGIEGVVDFAGEVGKAELVEPARIVPADQLQRIALGLRYVRVVGIGFGREEVGRVRTHLVQVHKDERKPFLVDRDAATCLGLRQRNPVAVHVEQVVVGAPAWPWLVAFGRDAASGRFEPGCVVEAIHEAVAAIGVLDGVDEDQRVGEDVQDGGVVAGGEKMIGRHHRGVR